MMNRIASSRRSAGSLLVVVLVIAGGATVLVAGRGAGEAGADSVVAELSALRSSPPASETLPEQIATGFVRDEGGQMESARSVGEFEGSDYYLIPTDADQLCLVSTDPNGLSGGACVNRTQLLKGVSVISHAPDGRRLVATIVPDGYREPEIADASVMKQSAVRRNVAFAKLGKGQAKLRMPGEAGRPDITYTIH